MDYGFNGIKIPGNNFPQDAQIGILDKKASTIKRQELSERNIYSPTNAYNISSPLITKTINDLINFAFPNVGDLRNTLIGRNLPPVTPLVQIANEQLLKSLKQRLIIGFQREKLSELIPKVSVINLLDGNPETKFLTKRYDYTITQAPVKQGDGGIIDKVKLNALPFLKDILGVNIAREVLNSKVSFASDAGQENLFLNTGEGTILLLSKAQSNNIYSKYRAGTPDLLTVLQREKWTNSLYELDGLKIYDYFGERTPENISFIKGISKDAGAKVIANGEAVDKMADIAGFGGTTIPDFDDSQFSNERDIIWGVDDLETLQNKFGIKRGLLYYTGKFIQESSVGFKYKQNTRNFTDDNPTDQDKKGNRGNFTCRIHTKVDKYGYSQAKAIRYLGHGRGFSPTEFTVKPIISPIVQANTKNTWNSYKNVMFYIENLAWGKQDLIDNDLVGTCEHGTLDGRIMWFPPYDLSIAESSTASWDNVSFIGRGEPVYTYNNSERGLTLSWKLIMDYPEVLDTRLKGATSEQIARFFACDEFPNLELPPEKEVPRIEVDEFEDKVIPPPKIDLKTKYYFANDVPVLPNNWETEITPSIKKKLNPEELVVFRKLLKGYKLETNYFGRTFKRNGFKTEKVNDDREVTNFPKVGEVRYGQAVNDVDYGYYWQHAILDNTNYTKTISPGVVKPVDLKDLAKVEYKIKEDYYGKLIPIDYDIDHYYPNYIGTKWERDEKINLGFLASVEADITLLQNTFEKPKAQVVEVAESVPLLNPNITGVIDATMPVEPPKIVETNDLTDKFAYEPKDFELQFIGNASLLTNAEYNQGLGYRRAIALYQEFNRLFKIKTGKDIEEYGFGGIRIFSNGEEQAKSKGGDLDGGKSDDKTKQDRNAYLKVVQIGQPRTRKVKKIKKTFVEIQKERGIVSKTQNKKPCGYDEEPDGMMYKNLSDKSRYYHHAFHSQTPEDFHRRLTFLQQCMRQGQSLFLNSTSNKANSNTVFGKQPFCILNIGDLLKCKIIIESMSINYDETQVVWDMNPESMGMQPMVATVSLTCKIVGGMSMKAPIEKIQNAVSFNYYKNSTFYGKGRDDIYDLTAEVEAKQSALFVARGKNFYSV